ncbi:Oligopeptide transporter 3 [Capsicum baccatum]|uniref:Oligopeptide transporter 3 n=1 Tax=Capsicum baccatum TaxID=33114 RepID=A0A2G2WGB7_CAPBA|nr:Oligopeptide transporter 3 [Capsicum baccatum]
MLPAIQLVQEITGGLGIDVAVEALGKPQTFLQCVQSVRDGGKVVMIGLAQSGAKGEVDINHLVRQQIKVIGSYGARARQDLPKLIKLAESGIFNLTAAVSRTCKFEEAPQAYRDLDKGAIVGRAVVEIITQPLTISAILMQIAVLPIGKFMAATLPKNNFALFGRWGSFSLNPEPFNIKEHVVITVMANCGVSIGGGDAYSIGAITVMRAYYKQSVGFLCSLIIVLTTQADLKHGHYMKIPPRCMYTAQLVGTLVASTINLAVAWWMLGSIENICDVETLHPDSPWTCPKFRVTFDASVIWGLIGPQRLFGPGGLYRNLVWLFLIEALAAQYAAESTLRRVYADQKDDDSPPIEPIIAPLESEIKMYKNDEQKRTMERELARLKISANRVATVVANEWKDDNDKVMHVKQWLEERKLLQRQARGVRENRLKLRLKTLEEGLTQATSDTVIPNGSPKPQKTNHLFSILSSNAALKKRSMSQPRASTINRSSVNGRDDASKQFKEAGSGDSLVKKSLWASRNKVVDNADKENA